MFKEPLTKRIVDFLTSIGLDIRPGEIDGDTFLPGILIDKGAMMVDESKLKYPGDLLHEAGHLAVAPSQIRKLLSDKVELPDVDMEPIEAGAIAWSYAAALHLGIDPAEVFHEGGYLGRSQELLMNFQFGVYLGLNVLEEAGMAITPRNAAPDKPPFPEMRKWLSD